MVTGRSGNGSILNVVMHRTTFQHTTGSAFSPLRSALHDMGRCDVANVAHPERSTRRTPCYGWCDSYDHAAERSSSKAGIDRFILGVGQTAHRPRVGTRRRPQLG